MKKSFFRVKQLADQQFRKVDKSEACNHTELQIADHKVEYLRNALTTINKKIPVVQSPTDIEKRLAKRTEYQIHLAFEEALKHESDLTLFQEVIRKCDTVEYALAKEYVDHEIKVEELVSKPLQELLDNEFPSILKLKGNLKKYLLDLDSATSRYNASKKEAVKDDLDEADSKVEQNRDVFATEMFSLLARQNEITTHFLQLLKLQRGYHESALKNLEEIIPVLERKIGDTAERPIFGVPLHEHLRVTNRRIAFPIGFCTVQLERFKLMSEEGLFRIAGPILRVKRLKSAIDSSSLVNVIHEYRDAHVLASTLKLYLRELPDPILTYNLHNEWMQSMQLSDSGHRLQAVKELIKKLPQENRDNLTYLIQFFAKLSQIPENKMSSSNLAIVIAPNLLWDQDHGANMNMGNCATVNMLVELFIKKVHELFPDPVIDFMELQQEFLVDDFDDISTNSSNNSRSINNKMEMNETSSILNVSMESVHLENSKDSPKPNSRKKKPAAPVPPSNLSKTDQDLIGEKNHHTSSYPSGSSTLTRPQKPKDSPKSKQSIGIGTDDNNGMTVAAAAVATSPKISRRQSFNRPNDNTHKGTIIIEPKGSLVNVVDTIKNCGPINTTTNINKTTMPIAPAQQTNCDKNFKTTVTHQVGGGGVNITDIDRISDKTKPIAAPRSSINPDLDRSQSVKRTPSMKNDVMSKSESEALLGDVQLRRSEAFERLHHKPEVPARPASLMKRSSIDSHLDTTTLHKTQCSIGSVANKQQPSIVNLQNRNEKYQPGHDNQIQEKEKFLGHQPSSQRSSLENRVGDINSNCSIVSTIIHNNKPGLPPKMPDKLILHKSNEKLEQTTIADDKLNISEKINNGNQKPSHTRTRSDGNYIELTNSSIPGGPSTVHHSIQTPPSPRSLNKPTQPPPPPPVNVNINKIHKEPDSTDL